jgi:type IV secretory pathway TraG/TraD family ATPase VirD4
MESQIYYRPSDLDTAKYLEERLGRRSDFARSQTSREGEDIAQGLSEQAVPLMTAQEIMQMGDTDVIGFHRRLPPFRAKRMDWRALSPRLSVGAPCPPLRSQRCPTLPSPPSKKSSSPIP